MDTFFIFLYIANVDYCLKVTRNSQTEHSVYAFNILQTINEPLNIENWEREKKMV